MFTTTLNTIKSKLSIALIASSMILFPYNLAQANDSIDNLVNSFDNELENEVNNGDYSHLSENILKPQDIKNATTKCEHGNLSSCETLGIHYLVLAADHGIDIDLNMTLSLRNLEKACMMGKGTPNSCLFLGKAFSMYGTYLVSGQKSETLHKNTKEYTSRALVKDELIKNSSKEDILQAQSYFEQGCRLRDPYSCSQLGSMIFEGITQKADSKKGLALFELSCAMSDELPEYAKDGDNNVGTGCLQAGGVYLLGKNIDKDITKGLNYLEKGCNLNTSEACIMLSNHYQQKNDNNKSIVYLQKACVNNNADGCLNLAIKYHDQGDDKTANTYLAQACSLHNGNACTLLSSNLMSGTGIKQDGPNAYKIVKHACDSGSDLACFYVAQMYHHGVNNVPNLNLQADINVAQRLYDRSCQLGNYIACEELRKLNAPHK